MTFCYEMMGMFNPAVSGGFSCQALPMESFPAFEACARPCFSVAAWSPFLKSRSLGGEGCVL